MLDKYAIHLKNIIFFKVVVYFFLTLILLWLIVICRKDYEDTSTKYETAQHIFSEGAIKLYAIINSENEILSTYDKYEKLISSSIGGSCVNRLRAIDKVKELSLKYNLVEPIKITIVQSFNKEDEHLNNPQVEIKNYDYKFSFYAANFGIFYSMAKDIISLMPQNSFIFSLQADDIKILTPSLINRLNQHFNPNLIEAKLKIRIREITPY